MRLAPDQVDQNVGDLVVVVLDDIDAGQLIRQVFAVGKRLRLGVGRLVGHRVDGGAANALQSDRVGMDRNEQVGLVLAGDADAVVEPQEVVGLARQTHVVAAVRLELGLQLIREGQRDLLFDRAVQPLRAAVDAAMAGVDHDGERRWSGNARLCRPDRLLAVVVEPVVSAWIARAASNSRSEAAAISATMR